MRVLAVILSQARGGGGGGRGGKSGELGSFRSTGHRKCVCVVGGGGGRLGLSAADDTASLIAHFPFRNSARKICLRCYF